MPMYMLTALQTTGIFGSYLLVTVGLPAFVLEKKCKGHRGLERFVFYYMAGNFYVMNLVFLLQLLKISYPVTLLFFTVAPAVWARIKLNQIPVRRIINELLHNLKKISNGHLGLRTVRFHGYRALGRKIRAGGRFAGWLLFRRTFDVLLFILFMGLLFWLYGGNLLQEYGYKASDMPVHNYWINALGENHIFVAGVYPHGFHCVVYYLHAVFGFDTYNILRIFGFVQCIMVHLMLLCFLKLCCRTRYAAYTGAFLYAGSKYLAVNTYSRYYAALPQEFGILFILPAVYFGFAYFEAHKKELMSGEGELPDKKRRRKKRREKAHKKEKYKKKERGEKKKRFHLQWKDSYFYLAGFAMSFSMTLAVHFYGTMIAGLFCAAMAVGYAGWFFRRQYFRNVVITCMLSVAIAVFPMAAAFIGGTPLQGSLKWGMNIITKSEEKEEAENEAKEEEAAEPEEEGRAETETGSRLTEAEAGKISGELSMDETEIKAPVQGAVTEPPPELSMQEKLMLFQKKAADIFKQKRTAIYNAVSAAVLRLPEGKWVYRVIDSFFVLTGLGFVLILLRQKFYGAMIASSGIYMLLLSVMMAAGAFGLPALMDSNRGGIYFAYSLPIAVSFLMDAALVFIFLPLKWKWPMHVLSLGCVVVVLGYVWQEGQVREPRETKAQEMNEAITCMENILENEEDFTWTIVSANDELRMGTDHGYHYETSTFLEDMEEKGARDFIRIPTPVVYIFIEKIPLDYYVSYENSGQSVSEEGAARPLPASVGIEMYQGEKRWILMSRMYYWAEEFKRLYPNEMETYLETEQFVCYRVEQNPYRLYNFAIDYGYNAREPEQAEEISDDIS